MRTTRTLATGSAILVLLAGTALGAGAQSPAASELTVPVGFTGRMSFGPQTGFGAEESVDGHTETRGNVFAPTVVDMSEQRLVGTVTLTLDVDDYPVSGAGEAVSLRARTWRIENDAGAWEGPDFVLSLPQGSISTTSGVLTGEGAYAGLLVAWQISLAGEGWDVQGFIVPGDAPPGEQPLSRLSAGHVAGDSLRPSRWTIENIASYRLGETVDPGQVFHHPARDRGLTVHDPARRAPHSTSAVR